MNPKKKSILTKVVDLQKKGEGTMSATTQNFVYEYGKKKNDKPEPKISAAELKEIRAAFAKYLSDKK